jgi:hypothetical protein
MGEPPIRGTIEQLTEQDELWRRATDGNANHEDRRCYQALNGSPQGCLVMLRRRRDFRKFGFNLNAATARPSDVVEQYEP